jgi:hypothetical protein
MQQAKKNSAPTNMAIAPAVSVRNSFIRFSQTWLLVEVVYLLNISWSDFRSLCSIVAME